MRFLLLLPFCLSACSDRAEPDKAALSPAAVASEAAKLKLEPGQWETTTTVKSLKVPGLSADQTSAATGTKTTTSNCMTPENAGRPGTEILSGTKDGNCSYQRFSMGDGRIDAAMTCSPRGLGGGMAGSMAMTLKGGYAPTRFGIGMDMRTDLPGGQAMTMTAGVSGRRTGACTAEGKAG